MFCAPTLPYSYFALERYKFHIVPVCFIGNLPVPVVGEVAVLLMIPWTGHVRQMGSYRLDLPHERVTNLTLVVEHVVGEVTDVKNGVVHLLLRVVHEKGQR